MGREHYTAREQNFYKAYINSPQWKAKRASKIKAAGGVCEFTSTRYENGVHEVRCTRTRYLTVHHNTYERLGRELHGDLDVFCYAHHMIEHLMQMRKCQICGSPCLLHDGLAELWLYATLASMGIDLDSGPINWRGLPTKEQLAQQIDRRCPPCRGINVDLVKPSTDDD